MAPSVSVDIPLGIMQILVAVACAGLVASGASTASAQPVGGKESPASIVVFKLAGSDDTEQLRSELTEVVRQTVDASSAYELVNDEPVVLSDVTVVLGCSAQMSNTSCLGRAAEHFDADLLIFGEIEEEGGRSDVSVRLFDPGRGRYVRSFGRVLDALEDPYSSFRRELDRLLELESDADEGSDELASLEISTRRRGAVVRIDGEKIGRTPVTAEELEPGSHLVEVEHPDFERWSSRVQLSAGDEIALTAPLRKKESTPADDSDARRAETAGSSTSEEPASTRDEGLPSSASRRGVSQLGPWIAVGTGGVSLVGAAIYGARVRNTERELEAWRAENPSPADRCVGRECELIAQGERAETANRVLLGLGGAMTIGGVLWFTVDRLSGGDERAESAVAVEPGGSGVSIRW